MTRARRSSFLRRTVVPLFVLICSPPATLLVWEINVAHGGSVTAFAEQVLAVGLLDELASVWKPVLWGTAAGWKIIGVFAAVQLLLMRLVPGRSFAGPATPKGYVPVYRANGVACFVITLGLFLSGGFVFNWFEPTVVYDNFAGIIGALNISSLAFCLLLYFKGRFFPSGPDGALSGNFVVDYFWGTELYPRILGWDVKMFTNCRFGLMSWPIIVLSFAAKQAELGGLSDSMVVALVVMLAYLAKFFIWETGYLCSIDIMHDRAGFMICWGCLVWVPAVYTSPILYLVHHPHHLGMAWSTAIAVAGVAAVVINYLADRQRQVVRATNGKCTIWGKEPRLVVAKYRAEDGEKKENGGAASANESRQVQAVLLASGWWGVARHFHYLPEILAAFLWTAPALFSHVLPWFYVIFLTILLVWRAGRDEKRCRAKYGPYWDEYCRLVPARILPGPKRAPPG